MKFRGLFKLGLVLFLFTTFYSCKSDQESADSADEVQEPDQTLNLLDSLIQNDARNADLYFDRALHYKDLGLFPKAKADIYSALHIDSANADYYLFAGELFLEMGEGINAAGLMSKAINMNPTNEELYIKAIEYNYYLKNYETAVNFANDLIALNKYNADAYFLKAMTFKELGNENKAISTFQTCVEVDPSFYNAHMQLGLIYSYKGDDLAIQYFENAMSLKDNSREAMYAIAYHFQQKDEFQTAVKKYKEMIAIDPKDHEIFFNLGHCYIGLDSLTKAYKHFDLATQIHPQYAGAYYMKGNLSEAQGNREDAFSNYQQALKMLPGDTTILNAINRVQ